MKNISPNKQNRNITEELRQQVLKRDNYACRYCGSAVPPFHIDHVYPFSKGGLTVLDNLVTACRSCNGKKSNKIGWLPNPNNVNEQIEKKIGNRFPIIGLLSSSVGLMIIVIGFAWSKTFGFNFEDFFWLGVIVGFIGIATALKGY
jgi:hypothetical protein